MKRAFYKKLFQKDSFIRKMLVSILGLICIPLLGLQLVSLIQSTNEFEKVNSRHYVTMLQSLADSFGNELTSLSKVAIRISLDDSMEVPVKVNSSPYSILEASYALNRYNSIHPLSSSAGIYYRSGDKVMHKTVITSLEYFSYGYHHPESEGAARMQAFFNSVDSLACYTTRGTDGYLNEVLFVAKQVTIPSQRKNDTVVFFTVEKKTLENWCSVFIPSSSGFGILSPEEDLLFSCGKLTDLVINAPDFSTFLSAGAMQTYAFESEEQQVVYKYRDPSSGYLFLSTIPEDSVAGTVESYTRQSTAMLFATALLVCVLLGITLYINYKPVADLLSRHVDSKQLAGMSELELIDSHFFALDEKLNDQNRLLGTFVLGDLLSGQQVTREDIDSFFPNDVYRYFAVAICKVYLNNAQVRMIVDGVEQRTKGLMVITSIPNQNEMVFLHCARANVEEEALRSLLAPLVEEVTGRSYKLYFGSAVTEAEQIYDSYKEALAAACPEDISGIGKDDAWLSELILTLEQAVSDGSKAKVLQLLNQLELLMREMGSVSRRYFLFKTVNACVSGLQKNSPEIDAQELDRLISLKDFPTAFQVLRKLPARLHGESSGSPENTDELCRRMIDYVDRSCTDSGICLTAVADYLQTSIYTVSRLFKEKTGLGFKEYITGKRLEKACSLLTATSMTVTEIAAACGFESISYFGAVFKNVYGISPSKYRDKQKHE